MVRYSNVLEMVGRTPLLEVTRIDTGPCRYRHQRMMVDGHEHA